jgi:MFS family permease
MFQLAYLLAAPIISQFLPRIGRKNSILTGYTLIVLATFGFGFIAYVPKGDE